MLWIEAHGMYYICGVPGNYAIKAQGNNRIILRNIQTLKLARSKLGLDN